MTYNQMADFSDCRTFLVRPDDRALGACWSEDGAGFEQTCDGPIYIVVGRSAPHGKLAPIAERFGLALGDLVAFRDTA